MSPPLSQASGSARPEGPVPGEKPLPRKVLLCLRYGIGDLIMELPALTALRTALPDAEITAIGNPPAHELLEGDPRVDRLVVASDWGLRHRWDPGDQETRATIAAWVRSEAFGWVLDARHATEGVAQVMWNLEIPAFEGDREVEGAALRRGEGGVEAIRAGIRAGWGIEVPGELEPDLHLRAEDAAFADSLLDSLGVRSGRSLAISPVASHPLKRWPVERFSAVADRAAERGAGPILVLEGPEPDEGRAVVEGMTHPGDARRIGAHHLLRTAALLGRCRGLVSNDTGLMHIAAAVGTPTVGVFGPTRSEVFLPRSLRSASASPSGLECPYREVHALSPPECWLAGSCLIADRSCIHRTRTEDVLSALDRVLAEK